MQKLDKYLKIADAALFLGVSQNTLRKWADEGRIVARVNPANGYRLFLREELEFFLKRASEPVSTKPRRKAK